MNRHFPMHVLATVAGLAALFLVRCGGDSTGVPNPNQAPHVRITAGPMSDSLHIYRMTFRWSGDDPDGMVTGYEYALDDTTVADSIVATPNTSVSLFFTADAFRDTVTEIRDGLPVELYRFGRHHVFYVRARDNEGAWSPFAIAAFYSLTVAPRTTFTNPTPSVVPTVGRSLEVTWASEDLDGTEPPRLFTTRLLSVPSRQHLHRPEHASRRSLGGAAVVAIPRRRLRAPRSGSRGLPLRRAGDGRGGSRGAVPPPGGQRAALPVRGIETTPFVELTGPEKTVLLPSGDDELKTFNVISGRPAAFSWTANAAHYAATIIGHAYGVDLESIDPKGPGWISVPNPAITVVVTNPSGVEESIRTLHLRIRDSNLDYHVVDSFLRVHPSGFTRDILLVDDWGGDQIGSPSNPQDAEHDRFLREVLLAEADRRGLSVDVVEYTNPNSSPVPNTPPPIIELRRYRLIVWNLAGSNLGIMRAVDPTGDQVLHAYLSLGGSLWLLGQEVLTRASSPPPPEFFGFSPGQLPYEFLGIQTRRTGSEITAGGFLRPRSDAGGRRIDGMDGANPTSQAADEGWPPLLVAREPYTNPIQGIPRLEGMTIGYTPLPTQEGKLDTLYTYVTNGSRLEPPLPSRLDDAPCAFRFANPPHQGKVLVFTFPVYWWTDGAADSLGTRAIDWFWEEPAP